MTTPKKSDDDELALQVEIDTGAGADNSQETPAKGTDDSNRQGLINQSLSSKIFDPKSLAKQVRTLQRCAQIKFYLIFLLSYALVLKTYCCSNHCRYTCCNTIWCCCVNCSCEI